MKVVGRRSPPTLQEQPSGESLASAARFNEAVSALAGSVFPKGVFRYPSHEAANRHQQEVLADRMAEIARQRRQAG